MRYRLQRHDGTDCSATMVPITVLRMVPIQRYRQLLYAFRKYFLKTDIKLLSKKFARKKINRSIPDWCFFTILPLCFIWWIITYSMIVDFIIKPLGLRGAIYNWL